MKKKPKTYENFASNLNFMKICDVVLKTLNYHVRLNLNYSSKTRGVSSFDKWQHLKVLSFSETLIVNNEIKKKI